MLETIDLADREYLIELLDAKHSELMHELHHASRREFKDRLRRELRINEELRRKLGED